MIDYQQLEQDQLRNLHYQLHRDSMSTPATFHIDDKVTVRVPVRLPGRSSAWVFPFGALGEALDTQGRPITPGIQLWIECVGVERATVREADGNRFEVDVSNLIAW